MGNDKIQLVVVDDQRLFSDLVRHALKDSAEIEVIDTFQKSELLFNFLLGTRIDVVLVDVEIPEKFGLDGFEIAKALKLRFQKMRVISISVNTQSYVIRRLIKEIGVDGFIDKNNSLVDDLEAIIKIVHQGHFYIDKNLETKALRILEIERLTLREKEITQLIVKGQSNSQIAQTLNISIKTVDNHRQNIFLKLECNKVAELAEKYYRYLYLADDDPKTLPSFKRGLL